MKHAMKKVGLPTTGWEYRFVNTPSENGGEDWISLKEVHYFGNRAEYGEPCLGSETAESIQNLADWWQRASRLPILHENDFKENSKGELK